ncbi:unnamed protein product [Darwinula stevensoni]|uniref:Elongation factor EFG domain-containing protein n=1 Tax=Darwinula stevensoni TaxID=69355 RepID=A0A7R9A2Z7_9CRUS|nr:unnamed protein product [Darwinula stevensoni]CAG0890758.1 unnamed protein product [Darwinula stevensoni]
MMKWSIRSVTRICIACQETTTGDILCKSSSSHGRALEAASKRGKQLVAEMAVPTPVFFCSIEPPSLHAQAGLEHALACLAKEDPSLRVAFDADTGQTVLAGMGELHLEIVRDRISKEYKIDAELGPLQVAYRETITNKVSDTLEFQRRVGESHHYVKLSMTALPEKSGKVLELQHTKENAENLGAIRPYQMSAVERGLHNTLACGPLLHCPVRPHPGSIDKSRKCELPIMVARNEARDLRGDDPGRYLPARPSGGQPRLLEPVMSLEISVHEDHFSVVLGDLARRRAQILSIQQRLDIKVIECLTPLSELKGYSTALRTLSSGMASVSMELLDYLPMDSMEQSRAIQSMTGISTSFSSPKCA